MVLKADKQLKAFRLAWEIAVAEWLPYFRTTLQWQNTESTKVALKEWHTQAPHQRSIISSNI